MELARIKALLVVVIKLTQIWQLDQMRQIDTTVMQKTKEWITNREQETKVTNCLLAEFLRQDKSIRWLLLIRQILLLNAQESKCWWAQAHFKEEKSGKVRATLEWWIRVEQRIKHNSNRIKKKPDLHQHRGGSTTARKSATNYLQCCKRRLGLACRSTLSEKIE